MHLQWPSGTYILGKVFLLATFVPTERKLFTIPPTVHCPAYQALFFFFFYISCVAKGIDLSINGFNCN